MTQDVAAARVDLERLCERLEKVERVQTWYDGGLQSVAPVNPDGPEASRAIRSLLARVAALEEENAGLKKRVERWEPDAYGARSSSVSSSIRANPQDERGRE